MVTGRVDWQPQLRNARAVNRLRCQQWFGRRTRRWMDLALAQSVNTHARWSKECDFFEFMHWYGAIIECKSNTKPEDMFQFSIRSIVALLSIVLWGCNDFTTPTTQTSSDPREATPALSMDHARERSARVGNVAYDLDFELDGEHAEFPGSVAIGFELVDANSDLTVDFVGWNGLQHPSEWAFN